LRASTFNNRTHTFLKRLEYASTFAPDFDSVSLATLFSRQNCGVAAQILELLDEEGLSGSVKISKLKYSHSGEYKKAWAAT
jgi:hypothetical protein